MKKPQYPYPDTKHNGRLYILTERPCFILAVVAASFTAALLVAGTFIQASTTSRSLICSLTRAYAKEEDNMPTSTQLQAVFHYATTRVVPQQSRAEVSLSFRVLQSLGPCNFLVFGLGHDSLMWAALNPRGQTLFLEEDPKWVRTVLQNQKAQALRAEVVNYPTRLYQADKLLATYKDQKECMPPLHIKGNSKCKLALSVLPDEVLDKEWDVIMIDAPRGYYDGAPGRMGAIYTAAVMARARKGPGITHVFLHDVNRKVEKEYAEEFLCKKNLVEGRGRLWHFEIPPATNESEEGKTTFSFC